MTCDLGFYEHKERAALSRIERATVLFLKQHASEREYLLAELEYIDALLDCHTIMHEHEPILRKLSGMTLVPWVMPRPLVFRDVVATKDAWQSPKAPSATKSAQKTTKSAATAPIEKKSVSIASTAPIAKKSAPIVPKASVTKKSVPPAPMVHIAKPNATLVFSAPDAKKKARTEAYEVLAAALNATETPLKTAQVRKAAAPISIQVEKLHGAAQEMQPETVVVEAIEPTAALSVSAVKNSSGSATLMALDEWSRAPVIDETIMSGVPPCTATIFSDAIVADAARLVAQGNEVSGAAALTMKNSVVRAPVEELGLPPPLRKIATLVKKPAPKKLIHPVQPRPVVTETTNANAATDTKFTHRNFLFKSMLDNEELHKLDPWMRSLAEETGFPSDVIDECMATDIQTRKYATTLSGECVCCKVEGMLTHWALIDTQHYQLDVVCRDRIVGLRKLQKFIDALRRDRKSETNIKWADKAGRLKLYFHIPTDAK